LEGFELVGGFDWNSGRIGETIALQNGRSQPMKYRIAMWATAGFLVAVGWAVYAFASAPPALTFNDPIMTLVRISCPIALIGSLPIRMEWTFLANAVTYAFVGLIVESMQQRLTHAK
jgi:hypothetical protein